MRMFDDVAFFTTGTKQFLMKYNVDQNSDTFREEIHGLYSILDLKYVVFYKVNV